MCLYQRVSFDLIGSGCKRLKWFLGADGCLFRVVLSVALMALVFSRSSKTGKASIIAIRHRRPPLSLPPSPAGAGGPLDYSPYDCEPLTRDYPSDHEGGEKANIQLRLGVFLRSSSRVGGPVLYQSHSITRTQRGLGEHPQWENTSSQTGRPRCTAVFPSSQHTYRIHPDSHRVLYHY